MYRIERIVVKAPHLEYVTSELTVNTVEQDIVLDPLNLDTLVKLYRGFKYDYITCVRGTLLLAQQSNQEAIGLLLDLITNGGQGFQLAGTEINVSDEGVHIGSFSRVNFSGSSVLAEVDYGDPSGDTVKITGLASINVINSLTSDSVVDALSAAQGKALKTLVDTKTSVGVLNVLDSMSEVSALSAKQGKVLKDSIDGITSITVVDNLASNSTTSALSAKQGKVLSDAITSAVSTVVVDSLSSNSETSALSAKQGKALKDLVDTKTSVAVLDVLNSDSATSALSARQGKALKNSIDGVTTTAINDSLTSDSIIEALSAKQGKVLKTLVDTKTSVSVLDSLTSDSATYALSAKQGKELKALIDSKVNIPVVDVLTSTSTTSALSGAQGRALKALFDGIVVVSVVNNLLSESVTDALSANQGRILKDLANSKCPLDIDNKVPLVNLPASIDDVNEYDKFSSFPAVGVKDTLYIAADTNLSYRWDYIALSYHLVGDGKVIVEDVLNSDSAINALSAKQGKALDVRLTAAELDIDDLESAIPLKADLISGIVPDVQLPAKNVLQYASTSVFPIVGAIGTIYIAIDTNFIYRWNGSVYIKLSDIDVLTIGASAFTRYDTTQSLTYAEKIKLADNVGLYEITVNTQSVLAYETGDTSTDNDGRTYLRMTNGSPNTVKIKTNQTKPITIRQAGAGATTLTNGPGVSLNGSLSFSGIHSTKTVLPISAGVYDIIDHY